MGATFTQRIARDRGGIGRSAGGNSRAEYGLVGLKKWPIGGVCREHAGIGMADAEVLPLNYSPAPFRPRDLAAKRGTARLPVGW
jgi:hypothetical protein